MAVEVETEAEKPEDESIHGALASAIAASETEPEIKDEAEKPEAGKDDPKTLKAEEGAVEKPDADSKDAKDAKTEADPLFKFSAADKAIIKSLPPQGQELFLRRHKEMEAVVTKKTTEFADFRKEYDPIDKLFEPYRDTMKQKGFNAGSMVQAWFNVEKALVEGKGVDVIRGIVNGYKLDPATIIQALGGAASSGATGQEAKPPGVDAAKTDVSDPVKRELDAIKSRLAKDDEEKNATRQAAFNADVARVRNEIETFKSAKDDKGTPLHPHFDEVEQSMALLAKAARDSGTPVPPISDLYESAVWAHPSTREKLLTAQRQSEEKKRNDEARDKAVKAKKASSSVTGAPGAGQARDGGRPNGRSIRDELLEAADAG